jgi:hypothetical protein
MGVLRRRLVLQPLRRGNLLINSPGYASFHRSDIDPGPIDPADRGRSSNVASAGAIAICSYRPPPREIRHRRPGRRSRPHPRPMGAKGATYPRPSAGRKPLDWVPVSCALPCTVQAPWMNAACERFLGSVRRGVPRSDHHPFRKHLRHVLAEYSLRYSNTERPHQGISQRIPLPGELEPDPIARSTIAIPVLGGLRDDYRAAA